jgi:predicted nuclease with RNAse H fold
MAVFLGIDLAGSPRGPTGMALLDEKLRCRTWVRYLDEEILADVDSFKPLVVGVDAPLGLPRGRESLESRGPPHFRECDLELRRRGIRFFPITIGAMRALTERGIRLSKLLRSKGYTVFEAYPGGVQDVLGLPRKQESIPRLVRGLRRLGVKGLSEDVSGDEADAATCALAAYMWWRGMCEELGNPEEGVIILPRQNPATRRRSFPATNSQAHGVKKT